MANIIAVGAWVVLSFISFVIYHKLFDVVYFSGDGCVTELIGCMLAGGALLALIYRYWWVALIVLVLLIAGLGGGSES